MNKLPKSLYDKLKEGNLSEEDKAKLSQIGKPLIEERKQLRKKVPKIRHQRMSKLGRPFQAGKGIKKPYVTHRYDLQKIDNARFMFNPITNEMVVGGNDINRSSHAEDHAKSGAQGKYDDFIKGWMGAGDDYPNGIIHFSPAVSSDRIKDADFFDKFYSTLDSFAENGANKDTIIRNGGFSGEKKFGEAYPEIVKNYRIGHQITEGTPANDLTNLDGIIKEHKIKNGYLTNYDLADLSKLKKLQGNPDANVKIYRASPKNELNSGDWVTTSKTYANDIKKQNGGKVYEYTIKAKDLIYPTNLDELPSLARFSAFKYVPNKTDLNKTIMTNSNRLRNTIIPFPRMIMQPPKEGAVKPMQKQPIGMPTRIKMPKAFGRVKVTKLLDGEISPVEKAVKNPMKGVTQSGKVNVPTGKIRTPGKTPTKTTTAREGQERAGHKYVKRERNPQGHGYRYWYKLPNGQLGTKKQLTEATKDKKRITGGLVEQPTVAKKNKIPKTAKKVTPKTVPPVASQVLPDLSPKARQGWLQRIGNTLGRVKDLFAGESVESMTAKNAELITQLATVINLIERLQSLDIGGKNRGEGISYKFDPNQINRLTDVNEVEDLLKDAQNPDNFAEMAAAKLDPKGVIKHLEKQRDFLTDVGREKQEKAVVETNKKYISEQTNQDNRVPTHLVKTSVVKYEGDFNKDNRKAASNYREYLINQDRKEQGLPSITVADYTAKVNKNMNGLLKAIGATKRGKPIDGINLDPDAGTITVAGSGRKKVVHDLKEFMRTSEDTSFQIGDKVVNGRIHSVLRFSRIGGQPLYNPIHNSVLNAVKDISDRVRKNPGSVFRAFGDKIELFDDKQSSDASFARAVVASKGSGKSQLIEGSVVASILGNAKGTYKAFIVDPDNTLFKELDTDDSALSEGQQAYKKQTQGFIDDGRLILFSPAHTLHQGEMDDSNYKDFLKQVNDRLVVESNIQATNRKNDPNKQYSRPCIDIHMDEFGKIQSSLKKDKALKETFNGNTTKLGKGGARKDLMRITVYDQAPDKIDREALGNAVDSVIALGAGVDGRKLGTSFGTGLGTAEKVRGVSGTDMVDVMKGKGTPIKQLVVGDSRYDTTKFKAE